jgi:hypothetical protein
MELILFKEDDEEVKNKKDGVEKNIKNKDGVSITSITGQKYFFFITNLFVSLL